MQDLEEERRAAAHTAKVAELAAQVIPMLDAFDAAVAAARRLNPKDTTNIAAAKVDLLDRRAALVALLAEPAASVAQKQRLERGCRELDKFVTHVAKGI
jgi:hypothetical protein